MSGNFYRAFEDRYRGSRELIKKRLAAYAPFLDPLAALYPGAPALDLGCGRGEWLELTSEKGFAAAGVDLDEGMLAACRERGLNVQTADALTTLRQQADASVALVSAFHLVEHLPFDDVQRLIEEALRILRPDGLLIMETPNPENILVGTSGFYLDPSHIKPIPPLLLDFVTEHAGFARHAIVRLQEAEAVPADSSVRLHSVLQDVSGDYAIVAQKQGDPAALASFDAAFDASYGISLLELAARFDNDQAQDRQAGRDAAAALDQQARAQGSAIEAHASAIRAHDSAIQAQGSAIQQLAEQGNNQATGLAGLDQAVQSLTAHFTHRFAAAAEAEEQARAHVMSRLEQGLAAASERMDGMHAQSVANADTVEQRLAQVLVQLEASERRLSAVEERTLHSKRNDNRLLDQLDQRVTQLDRRLAALPDRRARETEALIARSQQQVLEAEQRVQQLENQVHALLTSRSWQITAPARALITLARRGRSAVREGRIKSGLHRRLVALVVGPPGADKTRGVRGLLRRTKNSDRVQRILQPLLNRFPRLRALLRRLLARDSAASHIPTGDLILPDWHGPLPSEYLQMTPLARKILLDLARDTSPNL